MDWLGALQAAAPVAALKASFVAYPLVNALHIAAVGALVTLVVLMDLRLLGFLRGLDEKALTGRFRRLALAAFAVAAASGFCLFAVRARDYAANPAFLAKLAIVALAGVNFAVFLAASRAGRRGLARAAVLVSLLAWPAALVAGRFIAFL